MKSKRLTETLPPAGWLRHFYRAAEGKRNMSGDIWNVDESELFPEVDLHILD